jgi:hypothetical protein
MEVLTQGRNGQKHLKNVIRWGLELSRVLTIIHVVSLLTVAETSQVSPGQR